MQPAAYRHLFVATEPSVLSGQIVITDPVKRAHAASEFLEHIDRLERAACLWSQVNPGLDFPGHAMIQTCRDQQWLPGRTVLVREPVYFPEPK